MQNRKSPKYFVHLGGFMSVQTIIELVGYLGSALVIVSMLMTSVVKLRIINTIGSVIFAGYALCIHSYPTAAMQGCLIAINMVNLYRLFNTKKEYSAIKVDSTDSFLSYFLDSNKADITNFFPEVQNVLDKKAEYNTVYLVCCGTAPAGIFVGSSKDDGSVDVALDYTVPMYRDCSVGKYLYSYLPSCGIKSLRTTAGCQAHEAYLKKMGFEKSGDTFSKTL